MNATSRRFGCAILTVEGAVLFCGLVAFAAERASGNEDRLLSATELKARVGGEPTQMYCATNGLCFSQNGDQPCPASCTNFNQPCRVNQVTTQEVLYKNPKDCTGTVSGTACTPNPGTTTAWCRSKTNCNCRDNGFGGRYCAADGRVTNICITLQAPSPPTCPYDLCPPGSQIIP